MAEAARGDGLVATATRARPAPLPERASQAELDAHDALIDSLGEAAIWRRYAPAANNKGD
jgi:DNA polymerase-3 subunit epsilon